MFQLACDYDDDSDGTELQFIDYKRLSEDHLGSLFEGLLEYELKYADCKKAITRKGKVEDWSGLPEAQKRQYRDSIIKKGEIYLSSGSGERKVTGSYYTPQYIVDTIIENTLSSCLTEKSPDKNFRTQHL